MSVLDVRKPQEKITEIKWCGGCYALVRKPNSEVSIQPEGLENLAQDEVNLLCDAEEAENLILAIRKAIDLGWFK